jgi:integrase
MPLSDLKIKKLELREKAYMVRDEKGLYLEVNPSGAKYWRIRVWENGKEVRRSLGVYPKISLSIARQRRDEIHGRIALGERPFVAAASGMTMQALAEEWMEKKVAPIRTPRHTITIVSRLNRFVYPNIGHRPACEIQPQEILDILRRMEAIGIFETAHRTLQICSQVFRYWVSIGKCSRDPAADLRGALVPVNREHRASITDARGVGALMRAIDDYGGSPIVKAAMQLTALTFTRPGEIRHAEWPEFDLARAEWKLPPEKMKMRRPHIVPLSRQAIEAVESIRILTGTGRYLFPAPRAFDRPISDATVVAALRRMGFGKDEMSHHGFRSMASTILNEKGWPADAIERQLAHVEGNSVRAAYNYAEHLDKRREMMQWWADWLDEQKGK